jgi:YD repeat-containing protein
VSNKLVDQSGPEYDCTSLNNLTSYYTLITLTSISDVTTIHRYVCDDAGKVVSPTYSAGH